MSWPNYPIPANMEGNRGGRSPYSRLNTALNPRLIASDVIMGLAPGPTGMIDRFTGNRIRSGVDRLTGATNARNQQAYDAYMRDLMRNDPGNRGIVGNLRESWRGLVDQFKGRFGNQQAPAPYSPSVRGYDPSTGGMPRLPFEDLIPEQIGSGQSPYYGQGQGMMRGPAPIPRAPAPQGFAAARSNMISRDPYGSVIEGDAAREMFEGMKQTGPTRQMHDFANDVRVEEDMAKVTTWICHQH